MLLTLINILYLHILSNVKKIDNLAKVIEGTAEYGKYVQESNNLRSKFSDLEKKKVEEREETRRAMEEKLVAIDKLKGIVEELDATQNMLDTRIDDAQNRLDKMKEENILVWQGSV